jgi:hypothetical protein
LASIATTLPSKTGNSATWELCRDKLDPARAKIIAMTDVRVHIRAAIGPSLNVSPKIALNIELTLQQERG